MGMKRTVLSADKRIASNILHGRDSHMKSEGFGEDFVRQHIPGTPLCIHAVIQADHMCCMRGHGREIMTDHQLGELPAFPDFIQQFAADLAAFEIDSGCRLIKDQDLRFLQQSLCQKNALDFSA